MGRGVGMGMAMGIWVLVGLSCWRCRAPSRCLELGRRRRWIGRDGPGGLLLSGRCSRSSLSDPVPGMGLRDQLS